MILKYLIPYDRFVLHSRLSPVEAVQVLTNAVEPRKWLRMGKGSKDFEGKIEGNSFKITRLMSYRNSFQPMVVGRIEPALSGCTIHVHMRMFVFVMVFCILWFGFVCSFAVTMLTGSGLENLKAEPMLLIPAGMLVFFLLLVNGGFWFEANKQKRMLKTLFQSLDVQSTINCGAAAASNYAGD